MLFRSVFAADTEVRPSECSLLAQLGQPMAKGRLTASHPTSPLSGRALMAATGAPPAIVGPSRGPTASRAAPLTWFRAQLLRDAVGVVDLSAPPHVIQLPAHPASPSSRERPMVAMRQMRSNAHSHQCQCHDAANQHLPASTQRWVSHHHQNRSADCGAIIYC